jgi:hypothetical protein
MKPANCLWRAALVWGFLAGLVLIGVPFPAFLPAGFGDRC